MQSLHSYLIASLVGTSLLYLWLGFEITMLAVAALCLGYLGNMHANNQSLQKDSD